MKGKHRLLALLMASLVLTGCSKNYSRSYDKALGLFADGDYAAAAEAFGRLGDYASSATYAAYSQGLVLYDQGQYSAAEPYFAQTQDFMYGGERYRYCHAHVLREQEQFQEAARIFKGLGDFENASLWYEYTNARAAETALDYQTALWGYEAAMTLEDAEDRLYNLRGLVYNRAIALKEQANYAEAIPLFTMLGDYLSAADQAVECKTYGLEAQYAHAEALENAGDLQGAFDLFIALSSYRDAESRAQMLADKLGIEIPNGEKTFH